ncbi:C39 family peptidase, partial [Micromonospora zhanjiangensis]
GQTEPAPATTGPASPTPAQPSAAASPTTPPPPPPAPKPKPPASKTLAYEYQAQINFYYCGPASTRIALTAKGKSPSQDAVASRLGTTERGTDSAEDTTRVLNAVIGTDFYRTRTVKGGSAAEADRMRADVVRAITQGYVPVVNVAGTRTDLDGGWHSYDGGHYLTVVGYRDNGRTLKLADPANPDVSLYWMTSADGTGWAEGHGYSA